MQSIQFKHAFPFSSTSQFQSSCRSRADIALLWTLRLNFRECGPKKTKVRTRSGKSGPCPDFFTRAVSLIWAVESEIGGRYFGRQNVHLWSARYAEKVRKRWTEKTKVRTRSGKSGPCPDFFLAARYSVPTSDTTRNKSPTDHVVLTLASASPCCRICALSPPPPYTFQRASPPCRTGTSRQTPGTALS